LNSAKTCESSDSGSEDITKISILIKEIFGKEIYLDFTTLHNLLLRIGDDFSQIPRDPRDARKMMDYFELLDDQGDGIRSFVGIVVAFLILKRSLLLFDEPEAFLHPPQAFRIGSFIAEQADNQRQIIIATHSADILRGILSRTTDVDIIRIDRVGNTNKFNLLQTGRLKEIVNDPLLTSSRVLDGLFYSGAIVVEGDRDARFYHAVSAKLSPNLDIHFVNADNKQTVPKIVRLYKDMGVRSAGIVDFDILNNQTEFQKSIDTFDFSETDIAELINVRQHIGQAAKETSPDKRFMEIRVIIAEVIEKLDQLPSEADIEERERVLNQIGRKFSELADSTKAWKEFKKSGRNALSSEMQSVFDELSNKCMAKGFFINPSGELESMLAECGIDTTTDKKGWIRLALKLVPSLQPDSTKNPWKFVQSVHNHIQRVD
jgi:hypothetical protein